MKTMILVLDSFGIGALPDASDFGDQGANTFLHIAQSCEQGKCDNDNRNGALKIPNLLKMGLAEAMADTGVELCDSLKLKDEVIGRYAAAKELSSGKDTPSGHWELAGVPVLEDWGYFSDRSNSFPPKLLDELCRRADLEGVLGNCHSSGTEILQRLGEEHLRSGKPIVYTSADSVFQIAAHEESFGLDRLLALCEIARELVDEYNIGRVIARPFVGEDKASFERTGNRRDLAVPPPAPTVLDVLVDHKSEVWSVGKIADIFAQQGITHKLKANGLVELMKATEQAWQESAARALVFTNLVDFDMLYGHRRDVTGYAMALEQFDLLLGELLNNWNQENLLILTADHGCDPTWPGSDHTREYVPLLMHGAGLAAGSAGVRDSFADMAQTICDVMDLPAMPYGKSLKEEVQ